MKFGSFADMYKCVANDGLPFVFSAVGNVGSLGSFDIWCIPIDEEWCALGTTNGKTSDGVCRVDEVYWQNCEFLDWFDKTVALVILRADNGVVPVAPQSVNER